MTKKPPDKKAPFWFPSLLASSNTIESNSWFNILETKNSNIKNHNLQDTNYKVNYIKTVKIPIYPNNKQQDIIQKWYIDITDTYNITNTYLKTYLKENKSLPTFITLRGELNTKLKLISLKNKLNKHTVDYAVKHCLEMYKSSFTRFLKTKKDFEIRDLTMDRNRFNMVIEPNGFSNKINGFFISVLGHMNTEKSIINKFNKNCILQYQQNYNRYYILAPLDSVHFINDKRYKKCGIDLGVRTFGTLYSPERILEIGNNIKSILNAYYKKLDSINSSNDKKILKDKLYKKLVDKYGSKIRNKVDDLHKKLSVFLVRNYNEIIIGKMSTKSMVSNENSKIKEITKRMLMTLQFYKFNSTLQIMADKYKSNVIFINEYKTSMTCHKCLKENRNLGGSHIFNCSGCNIEIGRDINASINIYNMGFLKQ